MIDSIVSSVWLNNHLGDPNLVILDASQDTKQNGFLNIKISGARFFDIKNDFSDTSSNFPNSFPSVEQFENSCRSLGINNSSKIVVYDKMGIFSSPRVWWLFKSMGHNAIVVLDGGFPDWFNNNFNTEIPKQESYAIGDFKASLNSNNITFFDFIKQNIVSNNALVIDARSADRFNGIVSESRVGLRSGHIPNSINLFYKLVLTNGKFKSKNELATIFSDIDTDKPLVFSCGSGVTACIILLACNSFLDNDMSVYDGSWTEWAQLSNV